MSGRFNLQDYITVDERIDEFWAMHRGGGSIETQVSWVNNDGTSVAIQAIVSVAGKVVATGIAQEDRLVGEDQYGKPLRGANTTSWWENCETSAIGRALANMGMRLSKNRPSREEMQKVERGEAHQDARRAENRQPTRTGNATQRAPVPPGRAEAPPRARGPLTQPELNAAFNAAGVMVADGESAEDVYKHLMVQRPRASPEQVKDIAKTWRALKEQIAERDAAIEAREPAVVS